MLQCDLLRPETTDPARVFPPPVCNQIWEGHAAKYVIGLTRRRSTGQRTAEIEQMRKLVRGTARRR